MHFASLRVVFNLELTQDRSHCVFFPRCSATKCFVNAKAFVFHVIPKHLDCQCFTLEIKVWLLRLEYHSCLNWRFPAPPLFKWTHSVSTLFHHSCLSTAANNTSGIAVVSPYLSIPDWARVTAFQNTKWLHLIWTRALINVEISWPYMYAAEIFRVRRFRQPQWHGDSKGCSAKTKKLTLSSSLCFQQTCKLFTSDSSLQFDYKSISQNNSWLE